ncbi:putative phospholipid-transporting ATPase ID [Platysternon megacephalum]|uniref:Putative phospholipid-transporting ATPase ID n=1 Tax=Platysternon megacephalum TaxID=55544 RepID=A0A4D9DS52_9SAUR|nr:putative phospholipid-transporting ATPase ID [Platysternon megacephalum]
MEGDRRLLTVCLQPGAADNVSMLVTKLNLSSDCHSLASATCPRRREHVHRGKRGEGGLKTNVGLETPARWRRGAAPSVAAAPGRAPEEARPGAAVDGPSHPGLPDVDPIPFRSGSALCFRVTGTLDAQVGSPRRDLGPDMDNRRDEKCGTPCATSQEEMKVRGKDKRKRKRSRSRSSSISSTSSASTTTTSSSCSSSRSSSSSSSRSSSSGRDSPKSKSKKRKKEKRNKKKRKKENKLKKKKEKKKKREKSGPVQLSKYLKDKKKTENYSMITGKKIKMKIKKTKKDKERDRNRAELLDFLNSAL